MHSTIIKTMSERELSVLVQIPLLKCLKRMQLPEWKVFKIQDFVDIPLQK